MGEPNHNPRLPAPLCRRDEICLRIIKWGTQCIRDAAEEGAVKYCEIEADHIHNLPDYIRQGDSGHFGYYYVKQRPYYLEQLKQLDQSSGVIQQYLQMLKGLWAELEPLLDLEHSPWGFDWRCEQAQREPVVSVTSELLKSLCDQEINSFELIENEGDWVLSMGDLSVKHDSADLPSVADRLAILADIRIDHEADKTIVGNIELNLRDGPARLIVSQTHDEWGRRIKVEMDQ